MAPIPHIVLLGPTASGKTALALRLAVALRAEIVNVDSMQVYREMDIGTAKPTPVERATAPHHLLDVVDPNQTFNVSRFVELADAVFANAGRRGVPLIATGGTPMYYKALFEGLFEGPGASESVRAELSSLDGPSLHARLAEVDPAAAGRIHANDRKRLIRALEVYTVTGQPISELQRQWVEGAARHPARWFGLLWDKDALNRRINQRARAMVNAGWLDEVRRLIDRHGQLSSTAIEAAGYRILIDHLRGDISLDDALEQIKISTRQLARRQMKWFRRFSQVRWLDGSLDVDELTRRVLEHIGA